MKRLQRPWTPNFWKESQVFKVRPSGPRLRAITSAITKGPDAWDLHQDCDIRGSHLSLLDAGKHREKQKLLETRFEELLLPSLSILAQK